MIDILYISLQWTPAGLLRKCSVCLFLFFLTNILVLTISNHGQEGRRRGWDQTNLQLKLTPNI